MAIHYRQITHGSFESFIVSNSLPIGRTSLSQTMKYTKYKLLHADSLLLVTTWSVILSKTNILCSFCHKIADYYNLGT